MAAQFETGHAKNVANFNSVVSFCQGYGSTYNPALTAIQLSKLQTLAASALTALEECKSKQLDYDQAVDARMLAFAELRPLSQKMLYALKASGAPALSVEGAMTIYRKIQGRRKTAKEDSPDAGAESGVTPGQEQQYISVSQLSFDNVLANFSALVSLVTKVAAYQPNETALQVSSLTAYIAALQAANLQVVNAYTDWSNVRISRNDLLYGNPSGLVAVAGQVKNYVKSIYGLQSPQYKQLIGLQFTNGKL
jgi:hypothetical protein